MPLSSLWWRGDCASKRCQLLTCLRSSCCVSRTVCVDLGSFLSTLQKLHVNNMLLLVQCWAWRSCKPLFSVHPPLDAWLLTTLGNDWMCLTCVYGRPIIMLCLRGNHAIWTWYAISECFSLPFIRVEIKLEALAVNVVAFWGRACGCGVSKSTCTITRCHGCGLTWCLCQHCHNTVTSC